MKRLTILGVSLLVTSITIMQIGIGKTQSGTEDILRKTFPVSGGGTLLLDAAIGTVDVRPTPTDAVTVRVIPQIKTDDAGERQRLLANLVVDATQQQNDVTVTAKFRRETPDDERRQVRLHFEISVPQTFNLDVNTVGAITTGDIRGNVKVATAGGSIVLGNIEGTLTVDTQGGSVTAGGLMDAIHAETSGGSFKAYLSQQPRSDSKISTSGGRIEMRLAQTVGVELDAVTTTGRVTTDNPALTDPHEKQNVLQTTINGGGPKLVLRAADGSIRVAMSSEEHGRHGSLDHLEQNWR